MALSQTKTYTVEEFEEFIRRPENRDRYFELINGAIAMKAYYTDECSQIAEVMSPDDSIDDLRDKAKFYTASGVRLVWLVFPRQKIVEVYRPDRPIEMLTVNDTLEDNELLPGFSLSIAKIFVNTPEK